MLFDIIGLIGVSLIVAAYFLIQIEKLKPNNIYYSILNILGSLLILVSLSNTFNLPSAIIESFWILISLIGLYRHRKKK